MDKVKAVINGVRIRLVNQSSIVSDKVETEISGLNGIDLTAEGKYDFLS